MEQVNFCCNYFLSQINELLIFTKTIFAANRHSCYIFEKLYKYFCKRNLLGKTERLTLAPDENRAFPQKMAVCFFISLMLTGLNFRIAWIVVTK